MCKKLLYKQGKGMGVVQPRYTWEKKSTGDMNGINRLRLECIEAVSAHTSASYTERMSISLSVLLDRLAQA